LRSPQDVHSSQTYSRMIVVLLLAIALVVFAQVTAVGPFIYTLF
jgi:hypothetical protein